VGTRCADHVTPLYPQNLALTSPTGGGRSVGVVRSRTKATEFSFIYNNIPETHHVTTVYSVATVLYLQFVLHVMLFRPCNIYYYYYSVLRWLYKLCNFCVLIQRIRQYLTADFISVTCPYVTVFRFNLHLLPQKCVQCAPSPSPSLHLHHPAKL